jgi:hypothetical protein
MNYNRFLELSEEFGEFVKSLHALYLDSVIGFIVLHRRLIEHRNQMKSMLGKSELSSDKFQDECLIVYKHLCGEDFNLESTAPFMTQREVKERTEHNGKDYILLGRLCVVQAYTYWETYLRKEIGIALGVFDPKRCNRGKEIDGILRKYVAIDFWGDMSHLRRSIIHNNNKATPYFNGKRTLNWFKAGEPINLDFEKMTFIFEQMAYFRNILHNLSLPPSKARFPS